MRSPIDPCLLSFLSHHGIDGAFEILSSLGDPRAEETQDAFQKLLGGENKPGTMKREHGPAEGEQDQKKPRVAEGSRDQGENPEAAGTGNSSR